MGLHTISTLFYLFSVEKYNSHNICIETDENTNEDTTEAIITMCYNALTITWTCTDGYLYIPSSRLSNGIIQLSSHSSLRFCH